MIACEVCGSLMDRPALIDAQERELCASCAFPPCVLCDKPLPLEDRLPFVNGDKAGEAHFQCIGRLQRALGWERSSMLIRRSGPAFRGQS